MVTTQLATISPATAVTDDALRYEPPVVARRKQGRKAVVNSWAWGLREPIDVDELLKWDIEPERTIVAEALAERLAAVWTEGKTVRFNEEAMEFDVVYPFRIARVRYQAVLHSNPDGSGTIEIYELAPDA